MAHAGFTLAFILAAYGFGFWDGIRGRPAPPLKGTYDSGEHDDRVEEYGDWH